MKLKYRYCARPSCYDLVLYLPMCTHTAHNNWIWPMKMALWLDYSTSTLRAKLHSSDLVRLKRHFSYQGSLKNFSKRNTRL